MRIRRPFTPKGGSERVAVESNRHHNIPLYASIGEIIDNSIEWKSSEIRIFIKYPKLFEGQLEDDQPQEIVFIDNGVGMNKEKLSNSLVTGFHEIDSSNEENISKFGVGCTYAFLSNCKKSEVYSKQKNGKWLYTSFNLDDKRLDDPTKDYPPDAIEKSPPEEYKQFWSKLNSGTITVWSNFDMGRLEVNKEEIPFWISRAYRKFIGEKIVCYDEKKKNSLIKNNNKKIKIYYNNEQLRAYDPLYVIPYKKGDKSGILYKPIIIKCNDSCEKESEIIVQFGLCPKEWRKKKNTSANDPVNIKERHIKGGKTDVSAMEDSRKISVIRNGREVSWLNDSYLYGRIDDLDRWWGIEISYSSELDELFNVKNMKYQVELTKELRKRLKNEIQTTAKNLREEIQNNFDLSKEEGEKIEKKKDTETTIEIEEQDLEEVKDTEEDLDEFLKKLIKNKVEREKILNDLSERRFVVEQDIIKRIPKDTSLLFDYFAKGGDVLMVKYMGHPWFKKMEKIEKELEDKIKGGNIGLEDLEKIYHEIRIMWSILLQTLVISLATVNSDKKQQKIIDELLSKWGQLSMKYLDKHDTEKESGDDE